MPEGVIPHLDDIVRMVAPTEPFQVRLVGASMSPTLLEGDDLWVEPLRRPPQVGEVVVYPYAGRMLAHRVIRLRGESVLAAGDASSGQREQIPIASIVGVVRRAQRAGCSLPNPSSALRALTLRWRLALAYRRRMRSRT